MAKPRGFNAGFSAGYGVGRYRYALAPYAWDGEAWYPPASSVGSIDLRPIAAQAVAGGAPQGFVFVAALQPVSGIEIVQSLHMSDEGATSGMRDAWEGGMGYRPNGANLVDLLWDQLTNGADPTGEAGPKPLMPTVGGMLELHLGGHSLVKAEPFQFGVHPHTNRVRAVLQRDFERLWEATNGHDHCRRVLDYHCEKYRVSDWREFVPQRLRAHVPGRLPHATTITDDFNRADNTDMSVGASFNWTDVIGNQVIVSNTVRWDGVTAVARARAESDLSSVDHYGQVAATAISGGNRYAQVAARFDSAADTAYWARFVQSTSVFRIFKIVTGTQTALGAGTTQTYSAPDTIQMRCNGSTLDAYLNGASVESISDGSITTGTRCGIGLNSAGAVTLDDFEAADLGGGSSPSSSPSTSVSSSPSASASTSPSTSPSSSPSASASSSPSTSPSTSPSESPSSSPSASPSTSSSPSASASSSPSGTASESPSASASASPSTSVSATPSASPSTSPSDSVSSSPSSSPSPSASVSASPSTSPSGAAATITIEGNVFTRTHGVVNVDSNRLISFQMTNSDDVTFDFQETSVT
jgi:hypothetical protein